MLASCLLQATRPFGARCTTHTPTPEEERRFGRSGPGCRVTCKVLSRLRLGLGAGLPRARAHSARCTGAVPSQPSPMLNDALTRTLAGSGSARLLLPPLPPPLLPSPAPPPPPRCWPPSPSPPSPTLCTSQERKTSSSPGRGTWRATAEKGGAGRSRGRRRFKWGESPGATTARPHARTRVRGEGCGVRRMEMSLRIGTIFLFSHHLNHALTSLDSQQSPCDSIKKST